MTLKQSPGFGDVLYMSLGLELGFDVISKASGHYCIFCIYEAAKVTAFMCFVDFRAYNGACKVYLSTVLGF